MGIFKTDIHLFKDVARFKYQQLIGDFPLENLLITQVSPKYLKSFKVMSKGNDPEITGLPYRSSLFSAGLVKGGESSFDTSSNTCNTPI